MGAQAQQRPSPRPTLAFTHDGVETTGYVLYARPERAYELRFDLGRLERDASGAVTVALPDLPPGSYVVAVAAYNTEREGRRSPGLPIRVRNDGNVTAGAPLRERPDATPAGDRPGNGDSARPAPRTDDGSTAGETPAPSPSGGGLIKRLWRLIAG
jgi:hypothetical protein